MSIDDVGPVMSPGEAWRLVEQLLTDPSSHVTAAMSDWSHPIAREALAVLDLYDLRHRVAAGGKRVKPHHGRPTRKTPLNVERQRKIHASLRAMGHGDLMDRLEGRRRD